MLKIRLQRVGRKHEPSFRLVLTDSKNSTKSGRFKEILGSYDPRKSVDVLKGERIKHWLSVGAQPTGTVHNLLVTHKILDAKKKNVLPKKTAPVKEAPVAEEASALVPEPVSESAPETPAEETPVEEAPKIEESPAEAPVEETPVPETVTEKPADDDSTKEA